MPNANAYAELRSRVEEAGQLRVVVTLAVIGPDHASNETIRIAQDRLLEALRGAEHRVIYRYTSIPALTLVVSAKALDVLLTSSLVTSIVPDAKRRPASD